MRKVARPHSAAKPTSKPTTSAAKPSAIPAAPWRKPSPGEKRITSAAQPSKHANRLAPAPKRTALRAKNDAISVYQSHQARLHSLSEDCKRYGSRSSTQMTHKQRFVAAGDPAGAD